MIIKNGYVVDPANDREGVFDILIKSGKIAKVARSIEKKGEKAIDARDKIVMPGLIDMHVHLREPGREDIETVASGTRAAAAGGLTSVCAMPNTYPPIDTPQMVERLSAIARNDALVNVFVVGAITKGRLGEKIVDVKRIKQAGAVALSDDGDAVQKEQVMMRALKKAKEEKITIVAHCENTALSGHGVINEGLIATTLGLRGIPKRAEYECVERDIALAARTKARLHIAHVSCRESVDAVRRAKKKGVAVTAETAPHYFCLYDSCCVTYDTRTKMNPPLRSQDDAEAIIRGIADGTIDAIASDHAPHGKHEKEVEFDSAAFGIIGLETILALAKMYLVDTKKISWRRFVDALSSRPASILGLNRKGALTIGNDADITIVDPNHAWQLTKDSIQSKSKNSPFIDWQLKGRATDVIVSGAPVVEHCSVMG